MMKVKKSFYAMMALAVALAASSCKKDMTPSEASPLTFSAVAETFGGNTKADIVYKHEVLWDKDDRIIVKGDSSTGEFALVDGAGTKIGTFQQKTGDPVTGSVEAFYPASTVSGSTLVWPRIQRNNQTLPMYSKGSISPEDTNELDFTCLGGVIMLTLNTKSENVVLQSIELVDAEKPLSGTFTVGPGGKAVISATGNPGIILDLGRGVALDVNPQTFYISVPAGEYKNLSITFTDEYGFQTTMTSTTFPEVKLNTVCKVSLAPTFPSYTKGDPLKGQFSVSEVRKVQFSRGNLYYDESRNPNPQAAFEDQTECYLMEDLQYQFPNQWDPNHVGHFYWSKGYQFARSLGYQPTETEETMDIFFTNTSVYFPGGGYSKPNRPQPAFTVEGKKGMYRILISEEWEYLLHERTDAAKLCKAGVKLVDDDGQTIATGVILAPDGYEFDLKASYNPDEWGFGQAHGLVFLPEALSRKDRSVSAMEDSNYENVYWTAISSETDKTKAFAFVIADASLSDKYKREYAHPVRLVTNVE